jgi:hypothetical protein
MNYNSLTNRAPSSRSSQGRILNRLLAIIAFASSTRVPKHQ